MVQGQREQPVVVEEESPRYHGGCLGLKGVEGVWQLAVFWVVDAVVLGSAEEVGLSVGQLQTSWAAHGVQSLQTVSAQI